MPNYRYKAVSLEGEAVSGKELAKDEHELAAILKERGQVLTLAEPVSSKQQGVRLLQVFSGFFGVSLSEKLLFMRNLKLMVAAGIPLPRTLDVLAEQAKSQKLKKALKAMKERILKGDQLNLSMEAYPSIFSELFVNMIKVGEESGTLETVLSQLTLQLEREHDLKSRIQGALMYPAVIVVAMIGIGIMMLILVVPNLAATFEDLGVELPATTKFVIGLGEFLTNQWYLAIPLFLGFVMLVVAAFQTRQGKQIFDTVVLHVPLASDLTKKIQTAFTARTLSSLIGAGVPIVRSLEITSSVLSNGHFRAAMLETSERVKKGEKISEALEGYKHLYPVVLVQMMEVGEETGQTGEILAKLAEFHEEEVANITKNFASIIEPVLMLIIGAVVGFFAISMIQPMYSMLGNV